MTVKELIKELQKYDDDMPVVKVKSWDIDEQGNHPTEDITSLCVQTSIDIQFEDTLSSELLIY